MKVLLIVNDCGIHSVYKADTIQEKDKAAFAYLNTLYKPRLEDELLELLNNKEVNNAYIHLSDSYLENADIAHMEVLEIETP